MLETLYDIALGSRAGLLNRTFTIVSLALVLFQIWRQIHLRLRINQWRFRFLLLEREAREEGVATVTDPQALPPLDAYGRLWQMMPSLAIMMGLFGTFVGLTLALSRIPVTNNLDAIQKGLSHAIPSMGTAFMTSLCGLIVALSVRITNSALAAEFRKKVLQPLMLSEPKVIEALEVAAFKRGWDGALLRPHGQREVLWHKNRELNQTFERIGPQITEGLTRGLQELAVQLGQVNQSGEPVRVSDWERRLTQLEKLQQSQQEALESLLRQNRQLHQALLQHLQQQSGVQDYTAQEYMDVPGEQTQEFEAPHVDDHTLDKHGR